MTNLEKYRQMVEIARSFRLEAQNLDDLHTAKDDLEMIILDVQGIILDIENEIAEREENA